MHEFGIASEIWESVKTAARRHGSRSGLLPDGAPLVRAITVEVGELSLIEDDQLRFWISALAEQDGSPDIELRVTHVPATLKCRRCQTEWTAESGACGPQGAGLDHLPLLRAFGGGTPSCPACGSSDTEVVGGREIRVVSAVVEAEVQDGGQR